MGVRGSTQRDVHSVYLVTFATSSWLIIGLFFFFCEPVQITEERQERKIKESFALLLCSTRLGVLTCFQCDGVGGLKSNLS